MFGTGYTVDLSRYPFLSTGILDAMKAVDGYPVLRRGLETSVSGLHIMGAPAARSVGPTMRFVSGSWYGGAQVAKVVAERSRRSMPRRASAHQAVTPAVEPALAQK